jgi:hypothetical protein
MDQRNIKCVMKSTIGYEEKLDLFFKYKINFGLCEMVVAESPLVTRFKDSGN